jgi:hypothetical protein
MRERSGGDLGEAYRRTLASQPKITGPVGITNAKGRFAASSQKISNQLPTPEDELQDFKGRLLVNCLVLCSRQLLSYEKATVTRQKEYACEQLTRGEIRRVAMP